MNALLIRAAIKRLHQGKMCFIGGEYDAAIDHYTKAIELNPEYIEAYAERAQAYKCIGKNKLADADFKKARELRAKTDVPTESVDAILGDIIDHTVNVYVDVPNEDGNVSENDESIDDEDEDIPQIEEQKQKSTRILQNIGQNKDKSTEDLQKNTIDLHISEQNSNIFTQNTQKSTQNNKKLILKVSVIAMSFIIFLSAKLIVAPFLSSNKTGKQLVNSDKLNDSLYKDLANADQYNERGIIKYKAQKYDDAIADYDAAIIKNPSFTVAYYNRGVAKYSKGDYIGAIADFDVAIDIKPVFVEAYYNRALAYNELGDINKCEKDYNMHVELAKRIGITPQERIVAKNISQRVRDNSIVDNNSVKSMQNKRQSDIYKSQLAQNQKDVSIEKSSRVQNTSSGAQNTHPSTQNTPILTADNHNSAAQSADDLNASGKVKAKNGDSKGAIADFTRAISVAPNFYQAFYNRGNVKIDDGDYVGAVKDFSEAIRIKNDYANAYRNRGIAYKALGKLDEAASDFIRAEELSKSPSSK